MKKVIIVFFVVLVVGLSLAYIIPTFQGVNLDYEPTVRESNSLKYDWSWLTTDNTHFIKYFYKENLVSSLFIIEKYNYKEYMNTSIKELNKLSKETVEYTDRKLTEIVRKNGKIHSFKVGKTKFIVNN